MRTSTAYNHLVRLSRIQADIYYHARASAMSHEWIMDECARRVYGDPALARCPGWVRALLSERGGAMLRDLYRPQLYPEDIDRIADGRMSPDEARYLRWFHTCSDGTHVSTWDDIPQHDRDTGSFTSAYRWNHRRDRVF